MCLVWLYHGNDSKYKRRKEKVKTLAKSKEILCHFSLPVNSSNSNNCIGLFDLQNSKTNEILLFHFNNFLQSFPLMNQNETWKHEKGKVVQNHFSWYPVIDNLEAIFAVFHNFIFMDLASHSSIYFSITRIEEKTFSMFAFYHVNLAINRCTLGY